MSLQFPGDPAHTRCLAIALRQGVGASIEYLADIVDLRKVGLMGLAGRVATAGIIHKMEVRGTYSAETREIEHIEWDQSHVMHEANRATQGECCRDPMVRLKALIGTRLGEGFVADLKQCFGGPLGCTHVNTLLHELNAVVTRLAAVGQEHAEIRSERAPGERIASRSLFFDAFLPKEREETAIRVHLTDAHFGQLDPRGNERLLGHDEIRLAAFVELAGWQLRDVHAAERCRRGPSFDDQPWQDRSEELGGLAGRTLGGGMARFCLERFGERAEDSRLLSALLSLAPGMTQVAVTLSDQLVPSSATRPSDSPLTGPGPCYMLRADGPLVQTLFSSHPTSSQGAGD